MLGIATALNALSSHGACTAVFVAVAATISFGLGSMQTLGHISWLAWVGVISILTSSKGQLLAISIDVSMLTISSPGFDNRCWSARQTC